MLKLSSVSPSVYVVFPIILATNDCGLVGNAYTSWTLGVPEHQLSTYQQGFGTSAFNPADLGCPGPDPGKLDDQYELEDEANQGAPSVLLPADLTSLDPAWKSCVLGGLDLGRDPPRALQPASNMAPKGTSRDPAPTDTLSIAFPHSIPKSPGPHPTQSSQLTKTEVSSIPEDSTKVSTAHVQEPSSVCSAVPRSHSSGSAESPPSQLGAPQIRPRNDALAFDTAKTSGLPSPVGAYISATSYAGAVSPILAWVSEMQSEASVGGLPPVAPSNPYLALPKHRSAKRSLTSSSVTQPLSSANNSTVPGSSEPAAEASLVRPAATSAAGISWPTLSSTKSHAVSAPLATPNPAPSDPKTAGNMSPPYEPCGQGNGELVEITTRDAHLLSPPPRKSANLVLWAATNTSGHSLPSVEHSTGKRDPSVSSGPASQLQSTRTIGRGSSRNVTIDGSNGSGIAPAAGTTSRKNASASTNTATGSRIHAAEREGLWIAFLGSLVCLSLI